ncbi:MAG: YkgJ family cysteine cluster protein [Alphaproteobacteria bacterium]|nr:YkgJ family cysteine cluster protein [Alphaproteobacteria bacterium]
MSADVHWREISKESEAGVMDQLRWFSLHRCDSNIITHPDGKKRAILRIPTMCQALDQDKEGKFFCKIYEKRPELCKKFLCERAKVNKGTPKIP